MPELKLVGRSTLRQIPYLETTEQSTSVNLWLYISTLGYGQSKDWSCFQSKDKTYDRPTCNMGRSKKAGTVLLKSEFYVGPVIFFTVFLFSTECSSAQVLKLKCFSRILNHQCSMFSHMLSPHKRFPCLHHKFLTQFVCKIVLQRWWVDIRWQHFICFYFLSFVSDKTFFAAPLPALSRGPSMLLCYASNGFLHILHVVTFALGKRPSLWWWWWTLRFTFGMLSYFECCSIMQLAA